jgi:hypothetical protein
MPIIDIIMIWKGSNDRAGQQWYDNDMIECGNDMIECWLMIYDLTGQ